MPIEPIIYDLYNAILSNPDTVVLRNGGDGCWLNSHIACLAMCERSIPPFEIILESAPSEKDKWFHPQLPQNSSSGRLVNFSWLKHIVPACETGEAFVVFDPLLFDGPAFLSEYLDVYPKCVVHKIRDSSHVTYAQEMVGRLIPTKDLVTMLNRDDLLPVLSPVCSRVFGVI